MMHTAHNLLYPSGIALNKFRSVGQGLSVREQIVHIVDAMGKHTVLQAAVALDIAKDGRNLFAGYFGPIGMNENILLLTVILIKHIMFHSISSSFRIVIVIVFRLGIRFPLVVHSLTDHSVHNVFLLFGHAVDYIGDSFLLIGIGLLLGLVLLFGSFFLFTVVRLVFLLISIGMRQIERHTRIDDRFVIRVFAVLEHRIDKSARICTGMDQAYFTNLSMKNVAPSLLKLIGVDRQRTNVPMFYKNLSDLAGFGIVEKAVGINTFRTIF